MTIVPLEKLLAGSLIPLPGGRALAVPADLAERWRPGDELIVLAERGRLLLVPAADQAIAQAAVGAAAKALGTLALVSDDAITRFFDVFAERLRDKIAWAAIERANAADVERARSFGRPTGRLALTPSMRAGMIEGLLNWRDTPPARSRVLERVRHEGWTVELVSAPLGVVGFVFEGRPNVFADATGVLRTGNTVVFRIGRDALGTARAIMHEAVRPALAESNLPDGAVSLLDDMGHEAAWAMFADRRLALAVARGSGDAVAQLGEIARSSGTAVSLHGTGGAWMYLDCLADPERARLSFRNSLDRKVCNTLNVCLLHASRVDDLLPILLGELVAIAGMRGAVCSVYVVTRHNDRFGEVVVRHVAAATEVEQPVLLVAALAEAELGREWEWEAAPTLSLVLVDGPDDATQLFNRWSPRFVASIVSEDVETRRRFHAAVEAPFVCDGMTRWVDGQFALGRPELGLSNWQHGRMLGRGAVLSGDGIFTVRTHVVQHDKELRR